jgi:glucose/arabinose dehydrogenase
MRLPIIFAMLLVLLIHCTALSQPSWQPQYPLLPTFDFPVELIFANDGSNRFFVVQQRGIIYVCKNNSQVGTRKVFLDISDRVSQSGSETGLLGLAFYPSYKDSGYFYVNYTGSNSGVLRSYISRYSVSVANADSDLHESERIIFSIDQPYSNHNGGRLAFGPDGYLYAGFGDGGSSNDPQNYAQDRTTCLGKILRINIDSADPGLQYSIPISNPYYKNSFGYREEIYAYGIRNPWKFSFDHANGDLWLGDVGQDTREEVDIVSIGGNYGWRLKEGFICTPVVNPTCADTAGLISPIWDYSHNGSAAAITGGYVYRGSDIPSLFGKYIFGDYVTGETWALSYDGINPASVMSLSNEPYLISTFGQDTSGNIFLCSYANNGRIYKLVGNSAGIISGENSIPRTSQLMQNYPNPFNPSTTIAFYLNQRLQVRLTVDDLLGRQVAVLVDGIQESGMHEIQFRGSALSSGVYFYRLQAGDYSETKKLLLLK